MRHARLLQALLGSLLLFALLTATPWVEVRVDLRDNVARAVGLLDDEGDEAEAAREPDGAPFWMEGERRGDASPPPVSVPANFADLAEKVKPSIVNVHARAAAAEAEAPGRRNFTPFFGRSPFPFAPPQPRAGQGTGFVVSADGYIVTNHHVIDGFEEVRVQFDDGLDAEATVIGQDPGTDVALLKIDVEEELRPLPLGDSDVIRAGDWVVAIGNALGLENTVTVGIVSAKHRVINNYRPEQRRFDDFIQTDAAINPGNSGGPLLDLAGEVIGINTAIRRNANTIGFAIPINIAKQILPELRSTGRVSRGWLGVSIGAVDEDTAELLELDRARGALIVQVNPNSPAEEAGLRSGDVVTEFNGEEIVEVGDLPKLVAAVPGGSTANLTILRKGKTREVTIALGELGSDEVVAARHTGDDDAEGEKAREQKYGFAVQALRPELADRLAPGIEGGVVISRIARGGPAAAAGLRSGDVVIEVNQQPVESVPQFQRALGKSEKAALLLVRRGRSELFVTLKPER